jgi:hypothetical protein
MPTDYADALDYEASDWPEADWESDFSEARKRAPARPQKYTPPPQSKGYVTTAVFQTAMDKVRADVATNARAIANVGSQHDALSKRTRSEVKALREQATRDREATANTLQMLAILPLLSSGGSTQAEAPGGSGTVTVATPPDSMSQILPLLLLSGFGGTSGSGGSNSGGMDSGMMLAVALMAAQPRG